MKGGGGGGTTSIVPAQIVIAGNTGDPEALCICEVLREMVQWRMQVVVEVVHSALDCALHISSVDYLLVVLTKGLLRDPEFARALLVLREAPGQAQPPEIVTVLADNAFDFPGEELFERLEQEGLGGVTSTVSSSSRAVGAPRREGARLAEEFKALLNILALGFSPHGSAAIMATQVDEICRRFRKYKEESATRGGSPPPRRSSKPSSEQPIPVPEEAAVETPLEAIPAVVHPTPQEAPPRADDEGTLTGENRTEEIEARQLPAAAEEKLAVSEAENKVLAAQLAAAEAESKAMKLENKALAAQLAAAEARANSMDTLMAELLDRGAPGSAGVTPPAAALAETRRAEGLNAAANGSVCCRRTAVGHGE